MNLFLEHKYLQLLSTQLVGFRQVDRHEWNFRCPICGDSKSKNQKQRGYIGEKKGSLVFHCFNCSAAYPFSKFLQEVNSQLYAEYKKELLFSRLQGYELAKRMDWSQSSNIVRNIKKTTDKLIYLDKLDKANLGVKYLLDRNVPINSLSRVAWTSNYKKLIDETFPGKYDTRTFPKDGIVFPLYSYIDNKFTGYQFRHIKYTKKSSRFVTCADKDACFVFGNIDKSKQVYVVEGCIDSLFIPNCLAVLSSSLWKVQDNNFIYFNDQESRNKEIVFQIEKEIDLGLKVVLLPIQYENMDVNDIVNKYKYTGEELCRLFQKYTYSGIMAKVRLAQWRKDFDKQ